MPRWLVIFGVLSVGVPAILYLLWLVHRVLDYACVMHARKFCRRAGFQVRRLRWKPATDRSGLKTEMTLVELDCVDSQNQRRLVSLLVWPFGVRKTVFDDKYPEDYDNQWPRS